MQFLTLDDIKRASEIGGAHLDALGKFDLRTLSADEYVTFCLIIVNEANKAAGDRIVSAWTIPVGGLG